jgi:glycerate kinase
MHIIIAPNTFKHSLSTFEVAAAIKSGFEKSGLDATYTIFPIADGGEGVTDILVRHLSGDEQSVTVQDPLGRLINTSFGLINKGKTAVIELARASGLRWLQNQELNPMQASTFGTGQLILKALDLGVRDFVIGLGNSATVDGGAGLLQALGVKLTDEQGKPIAPGAAGLGKLHHIELKELDSRIAESTFTVVCDVENPLLGESGAARVFGPQKGADPAMVEELENYLSGFNYLVKKNLKKDMAALVHGGAAGGTAAALAVFLNAKLVPGVEYIVNLTGFTQALPHADLLVTAEGGLDKQTLAGKGPYGVARLAKAHQIPVITLAGQIPADLDLSLFEYFDAVIPIGAGPVSLEEAIKNTAVNLSRTAWQIGNILRLKPFVRGHI